MSAADDDRAVREAYRPFYNAFRVSESIVALKVALILVPAGVTLDLFVYPDMVRQFFIARLLCDVVLGVFLYLCHTEFGRQHIRYIMFLFCLTGQIVFCYMIFVTDGASSTYYAGLNLVILAIGLIIPFSFFEAACFCLVTIGIYSITCIAHAAGSLDVRSFYNNLYFLTLTSVISLVALYFTERRRFNEFQLTWDLERRNRELAELDEYKSQFFANISHELRTPLTLILGPIQDLLKSPQQLGEKVATLLHTARENGLRLLNLVNDLLDLIRLEEGKANLDLHVLEINAFGQGMADAVMHLADTRQITVQTDLADSPLMVRADHKALERIFFNLLSNAIKFTPENGTVTVSTRLEDDSAVFAVTDTGIGISADQLPFIFDRFRQADASTTRKYTGTGIGLALVKELTENMGGEIVATSEEGEGTSMQVKFPLVQADADELTEEAVAGDDNIELLHEAAEQIALLPIEEPEGLYDPSADVEGLPVVLVVDDEPGMRRYLVDMLSEDYRVVQARDGRQGLEAAREQAPDLMVLDLMLPEIDGLEVCRQLKADEATRSIKIVLLTARIDEQAKLTALEHGADDFLTKPFGRTELKTRLGNLLTTQQLEKDLRANNEALSSALSELKQVQANLIQSEKLNALGSLSAGLLHEINNPLNYSLTAVQMLKLEPAFDSDDEFRETVDDINDGMQRIREIVSDLRAFAYPSEAEKQVVFQFQAALDTALRFTAAEIKNVNVKQEISRPDGVIGSHSHIVQILVNLLTNAARAIGDRGEVADGEIEIRAVPREGRYIISVRDNGVGMEPDIMQRVFDPFFTTRDVGDGMGMGLSICHTIVDNHGGTLAVQSEKGKWSEFTFDLEQAH